MRERRVVVDVVFFVAFVIVFVGFVVIVFHIDQKIRESERLTS